MLIPNLRVGILPGLPWVRCSPLDQLAWVLLCEQVFGAHPYNLLDQIWETDFTKEQGAGQTTQWESPAAFTQTCIFHIVPINPQISFSEAQPTPCWSHKPHILTLHSPYLPADILFIFKISSKKPRSPLYPHSSLLVQCVLFCCYFCTCLFVLQTIGSLLTEEMTYSTFHPLWYLSENRLWVSICWVSLTISSQLNNSKLKKMLTFNSGSYIGNTKKLF